MKTFRLIPSFFLYLAFSSPAIACDWELETTVLPPKAEYPKCLIAKDFEQILTTYNTYMKENHFTRLVILAIKRVEYGERGCDVAVKTCENFQIYYVS